MLHEVRYIHLSHIQLTIELSAVINLQGYLQELHTTFTITLNQHPKRSENASF